MALTPEAKVRNAVVAWAKAHGIMNVRMTMKPGVTTGLPDDLFLMPKSGVMVPIEFKRPGRKPTPKQWDTLRDLQRRGFHAAWFDNAEKAIFWLEQLLP